MKQHDQQEIQRLDARNSLEEYIIETRESIQSSLDISNRFNQKNAQQFMNYLQQIERWIVTGLDNCSKESYDDLRNALNEFNTKQIIQHHNDNFEYHFEILMESQNKIINQRFEDFQHQSTDEVASRSFK